MVESRSHSRPFLSIIGLLKEGWGVESWRRGESFILYDDIYARSREPE